MRSRNWLTTDKAFLSSKSAGSSIKVRLITPQKSNIDAKKWAYFKVTFSKPSFCVSSPQFSGMYHPSRKWTCPLKREHFKRKLSFSKHQFSGDSVQVSNQTPTETRVGTFPASWGWPRFLLNRSTNWGPVGNGIRSGVPLSPRIHCWGSQISKLPTLTTYLPLADVRHIPCMKRRPKNFKTSSFREG